MQGCNGVTVVLCGLVDLSGLESVLALTFPGQQDLFSCRPATSGNKSLQGFAFMSGPDRHCGVEPVSFSCDVPAVWYRAALGRRECCYIPNNVTVPLLAQVLFCYEQFDELTLLHLREFDKKKLISVETDIVVDHYKEEKFEESRPGTVRLLCTLSCYPEQPVRGHFPPCSCSS